MPNSSDSVTVSVAGKYTVTIAATASAYALTLDDEKAKIVDNAALSIGTTLAVTAGTFTLGATGSIIGGTISTGASGKFVLSSGGTLSGVTYDGTMDLSSTGQSLYINGGLGLAGATGSGAGTIDITGSGASLILQDSETLNNGVINLGFFIGGATISLADSAGDAAQTLTLGPSLHLVHGNGPASIVDDEGPNPGTTIINEGTITAGKEGSELSIGTCVGGGCIGTFSNSGTIVASNGDTLALYAQNLVNTGQISVSGTDSTLFYGAPTTGVWVNQGSIDISAEGTIDLGGTFTTATLNSINISDGGYIYIGGENTGVLLNGGTLMVPGLFAGNPQLNLGGGGTISGGTIDDPNGTLGFYGGKLAGVSYEGTLAVYGGLSITGGITLSGAGGIGAAALEIIGIGANLVIDDNETLNNAVLTLGGSLGSSGGGGNYILMGQDAGTLTLGPSLDLVQGGTAGIGLSNSQARIINEGTITADYSKGSFEVAAGAGGFDNSGMISVSNGDSMSIIDATFTNSGSVSVSGSKSVLTFASNWTNTGVITVEANATLNLGGTFTAAGLDTITDSGGNVNITGLLDNNDTLSIGVGSQFTTLELTGTISGGTIDDPNGALFVDEGKLSSVTYEGTLAIDLGQDCFVENGFSLAGSWRRGPWCYRHR